MLLLIDNYDSFSYNLYQLLGELGAELQVIRNDAMTVAEIEALKPAGIILSPGPGRPCDAGVLQETFTGEDQFRQGNDIGQRSILHQG